MVLRLWQIVMYCLLIQNAAVESLGIAIYFFCGFQLIYCLYTIWFLRNENFREHEEFNGCKRFCILMFVWLGGLIISAIETFVMIYIEGKPIFLIPDKDWIQRPGAILGTSTIIWIIDIIFGLPSIVKLICSICCPSPPRRIILNQQHVPSYGTQPSAASAPIFTITPSAPSVSDEEDEDEDDQNITLPENASSCVICLVRPANVYLEPCHHLCLCTKDARRLMQQEIRKCPLDNLTIHSTVQVFD